MAEFEEEDFASMFEASLQAKRFERGDTVEGTVVGIGTDVAFVSVGGKGEAVIELDELKTEEGQIEVAVGDRIQAMVVSTEGGLKLSRRLARSAASARQLEDAYDAGLPVEGRVEQAVKGGYEVRIGRTRAFCPLSQIDTVRNTTPETHLGKVYTFRILEYKEGGRNIIVSRRAVQEAEQEAQAVEVRKTIVPGAVVTGRVASVPGFGAFIELGGGVQGLLHVSEMGWSRVTDPAEIFKPGDEVTVKVLRVDEATGKIALGLKQLQADPWSTVQSQFEVGQVYPGRVTRLAEFGAFVELAPGIEGLAHASTFPPTGRAGGWTREVAVGQTTDFEILSIDLEKKRMGVAMVPEGSARASVGAGQAAVTPGARMKGKVERHEKFGVFVFLGAGRTGLIPTSETGVEKEADLTRVLPVGSEVEVIVLEVEQGGRRIRLSRKAVEHAEETAELRDYTARSGQEQSRAFGGSLADKLRGALEPRKK